MTSGGTSTSTADAVQQRPGRAPADRRPSKAALEQQQGGRCVRYIRVAIPTPDVDARSPSGGNG